ncbi:caspase, EACC1-associated type [Streptomyces werraensis]|uniref:caspase, EACC1-associated type n=1 Tax=Streptomyces werraensis TaxID=68284 RepID=UPI001CE2994C
MSVGRYALLIATGRYENEDLGQLRSPAGDARELAEVLRDPRIGDFEVATVVDGRHAEVTRAVEQFFLDRRRDDLLLLHVSCHGLKNNEGELHFAASDTDRRLLASTSVPALFVRRQMLSCRARSIVVLLDCCYSGAFLTGAKGDTTVHVRDELAGHGRAVLTATNRTEYAWEGERVTALHPEPSLFTGAVVKGLRTGEADRGGDGLIDVQELYDFVCGELMAAHVTQRPQMWAELEHRVVLARTVLPAAQHPGPPPQPARSAPVPVAEPAGALSPPRPRSASALLLVSTEALTELPCMEDTQSRQQFATVLGEMLAQRVNLRGARKREDVVAIVWAALAREEGLSNLLLAVELFEGPSTAAEVRRRIDEEGGDPATGIRQALAPPARTRATAAPVPRRWTIEAGRDAGGRLGDGSPLRPVATGAVAGPVARSSATLALTRGFRNTLDRLHGALSVLLVENALRELPSMTSPEGRVRFAATLAVRLGRPVRVRGSEIREDALAIAAAALGVPAGKEGLVGTARILDGDREARRLGSLLHVRG